MTYTGLSVRIEARVATVEVNASTTALIDLLRVCEELRDADEVAVVILAVPEDSLGGVQPATAGSEAASALEQLPQPVIAALEGGATGVRLELALACDIRIASETSSFSMPQVASGAIPSAGGTQRLARIVGRTRGSEMILLGATINAEVSLSWGLINAITPPGATLAEARRIAARIGERGPIAVRYAKEAILRGLDMPLEQALRYETDLTVILQTTDDRAEGVKAFVEKRAPKFDGR